MNDRRREPTHSDERHQSGGQRSGGPTCLRFQGVEAFAYHVTPAPVLPRLNEKDWRARIFAAFAPLSKGVAHHEHGGRVERGPRWNASKIARGQILLGPE